MSDIGLDSAPSLSVVSLLSQDSGDQPESMKLSLQHEGVPELITLYKDLIITGVSGYQLLPSLYDVINKEERMQIKRMHDRGGSKKATQLLLKVLEKKEGHPDKWERFVMALERSDYEFVAKALRGEEIPKKVYDEQLRLLEFFAEDLIKNLKPSEILPYLSQRKIINDIDRQQIQAEEHNNGYIAAMIVLLDRLGHYKNPNWYCEFLDVLCETDYKHLVEIIDDHHIEKWEKRRGLKTDETQPKSDDYMETDPKRTVERDEQRLYSSGLTVQEDYMSETGGAQPSLNNLSAPPPPPDEMDQTIGTLLKGLEISDGKDDEITQVKQLAQNEARSYNMASMGGIKEIAQKLNLGRGKIIQGMTDDDKEISLSSLNKDKLLQSLDREVESTAHVRNIVGNAPSRAESVYDNNVFNNEDDDDDDDDDETSKVDHKPLELRNYQQELAEPALQGKNCIIVAPTGSGKTHVAMKIIQDHREKICKIRIPKVIFLVEQSALAEQQAKQCRIYLGCKVKVITGETQRQENFKTLSHWLNTKDILVVTAQILVNALAEKDVQIQNFSLMVFDECHHAHAKHSYNKIMFHYMDLKLDPGNHFTVLPQVVGLTASVGVGRANTLIKAVNWIKSMMANMDAEELATVVKHRVELAEYVNIPQQVVKKSRKRAKDHYGEIVGKIMDATVRYMKNSEYHQMLPASVYDVPVSKGSPQFTQWVSTLWREQAKIHDQTARKFFYTCRQYLDMYNRALIVYNDARASDSLTFIEGELKKWEETTIPDQTDNKMRTLFNKSKVLLQHCTEDKDHDNPKLEELKNMILSAYREKPDSRGIVFVKTRELTKAIETWMQETDGLKELKPVQFVGAQASKDAGGMTKVAQDKALSLFRDGGHKIIIATSVAEEGLDIQKCNLVVRYDHVTNEIAMVQSRGRGRAEDSKYVVVAEDSSGTAEKEELNQMREVMMNDAIKQLREQFKKDKEKFLQEIESKQKEAKAERDLAAANQHGRVVNQGEYVLRCVKCSNFICMASDVKKIQNAHHAVLCPDIRDRVEARKIPVPSFQDENLTCGAGKLLCKECGSSLGNVSIFKQAQFPILKIEYLVIEDSVGNRDVKKKWKSVPFFVPELSTEDLSQQSRLEKLI